MVVTGIDSRPAVFLKFGVGLAISLGGILFAFLTRKSVKTCCPRGVTDSRGESDGLMDDDHAFEREPSQPNHTFPCSVSDVFLNEECYLDVPIDDYVRPENLLETQARGVESHSECIEHDREISNLRNEVIILEERERYLEIQLLEYYGLKEQVAAVMELQNRLRINNMETKLYNLKIESLQSDNRRLEARVTDYANVVAKLEAAKGKIKLLRKKLGIEGERNREQILSL